MAYSFKQRKDGGFDFFDAGGKKTNIESYTKNTGANINQLRQKLATQGDTQSQRIVAGLPTQFRAPTQQSTPSVFNTPVVRTPTMSQSKPTIKAPQVYTPKGQQAYIDARVIGTGKPNEVKQAIVRTIDRKNSARLDPQFKKGKSYEDIAKDGGFSIDEVKRYAERNHKGYGDQGVVGNAARATGQFIGGMFDRGAGIVTRPFNDASDLNRNKGEAELQQINKDYRSGNITPAAAMERANTLAGRYTTQKASLHDDGFIHIGVQSLPEFGGNFTQQGIDSASLLPVGGGVASGSARIASAVGKPQAAQALNKAASIMTAGAQTQATSKLANALTARGINPQTANLVGNAVTSNAKQAGVYGTAQTGADVASGRGISPESIAMNYGADFLMGAVPEIGLGSVGRGIDLNNTKVHQELVRTNPTYKANTDKLTGIDATIARAQANGDVRALEGLQAVRAQLSDSNALIARRYAEGGFIGKQDSKVFRSSITSQDQITPELVGAMKDRGYTALRMADGSHVGINGMEGISPKPIVKPTAKQDYAMSHRPTESGMLGSDIVNGSELSMPNDYLQNPHLYMDMSNKANVESVAAARALQGNPDKTVTIYRSSPSEKLNSGDWITLSKTYAEQHAKSNNAGTVHEYKVKAKDIQFAGDDINEFGYFPNKTNANDAAYSLNNNYKDTPATIQELNKRSLQLHGDRNVSINSALTDGKGNTAHGMYTYADDMIKIADGRGINTMNHESVHRAFKNHLTPDERTLILDEIKKTYKEAELRGEYEKMGYYKRTTNQLAEEQLANNFIKYAEARANGIKVSVAGIDLNIPRKVVALYERVYTKIKETFGNPDYVKQFYARLESGKYSKPASKDVTVGSPARGTAYAIDPNTPKNDPTAQATQSRATQTGTPKGYSPSKSSTKSSTRLPQQKSSQTPRQSNSAQSKSTQTPSPDNTARKNPAYADDTTPVDTKQYLKSLDKEQKAAGKGKINGNNIKADFKEKFIDDISPIEDRLNKAIKDGADVDPKDHITYQIDRSRRAEGITQAYMNDNGLSKIIQDVPNPKEFDQYLIARHAAELDAEITTGRNKKADAQLVKDLDSKYSDYAKRIYAYNQKVLDSAADYGLISKRTAKQLKKQYPEYVPFNRIFKEDELGMLGGNGKGDASISTQGAVKKLKGSERAIRSPLNSIIDKTRVVVEQGERNRAAQMLASYKDLPSNPFNLKEIPASETIGNRHTISYLDNGKKHTFQVDKEIADAAKNMTRQEIGLWGRIAASPARVLRAGATGVNAGFAGANVVKDIIGAAINSKHPFRIADPKAFGKALAAALNHNGKYYQELMREGVAGTSFDMYRNPLKSNVEEIWSQKNIGRRILHNATNPKTYYRTIENSIGRSEDFGRALQYYSNKSGYLAEGKNMTDAKLLAADQARNNSTNFFRHGSYGKGINLAIPYWNAGVQGSRIGVRRIKERPVQTLAKIGMVIAAPSAMIAMNNYSSEEKRKVMESISETEKAGNIIIVGDNATYNEKTNRWDGVYKIPVPPQHIGIHKTVQDAVESSYTGKEFDIVANLGRISENYTTIDPTNGRQLANKYTPQGLKLIAEPLTNTNLYTGNKIVPESQKNLPAADQYNEYTSGTAKVLGKATNLSPRVLDNGIRTAFGGAGQNVVRMSDKALASAGAIDAKDIQGTSVTDSITERFVGARAKTAGEKADENFEKLKKDIVASTAYKNATPYDKSRMLNRLQDDITAVAYNEAGKDDGKLTAKQKKLASSGFDASTYTNLNSSVTLTSAKTPASAKSIIETYDTLDTEARKKWNTEKNTDAAVTNGLQSWLGDKVKIPEVTNDVAKEWADFQNDYAAEKVSKLKENDQKKAILKKAFNSQLSTDEKEIHTLTKAELQYYYENGAITDENINKAIAVEKQLFDAGLIAKETLQRNLGSSARGYKTSSGSSGRKTSTKTASKASIAELFASQKQINDINNSTYLSLSKLLGNVTSGSSKMAKNKIGREVTLKKITGAKA